MKDSKKLIVSVALLYALPAHAYLDPASSSALIFSSWSLIFLIGILFTKIFQYIFSFFYLIFYKINPLARWDIVIHCEFDNYLSTFENFIKSNLDSKILFVGPTESINSQLIRSYFEYKNISFLKISGLFLQSALLRGIRAKYVVTSTPGINTSYYGKGLYVEKYVYIAHAASDIHHYNLLAFDHFDTVFCPNEYIKQNILTAISARGNLIAPKIEVTSLQYMVWAKTHLFKKLNHPKTLQILMIAPSWGNAGLLSILDKVLLNRIVEIATLNSLKIVFRPHPQSIFSKDSRMKFIDDFFIRSSRDYKLDTNPSPFEMLATAKILISDFSSIIYDYNFVNNSPISICYFNRNQLAGTYKESIFIESESLEEQEYKKGTYFCDTYQALRDTLNLHNYSHKTIDVNSLFIHEDKNYLLNLDCSK